MSTHARHIHCLTTQTITFPGKMKLKYIIFALYIMVDAVFDFSLINKPGAGIAQSV
jgi:hypothetical protein